MSETEVPQFKDDMQRMAYEQLEGFIKQRNSLVGTANAANGDRVTLKEQIAEESTDAEIVAAREARDEAIERLEALVNPKVDEVMANAKEATEGLEEKIKEIDAVLKPGLNYLRKLYGDEFADTLPKQTRASGMRVSNAGSGGRRVRGYNVTLTVDGEINEFENFASAAKWLDVETSRLQEAFFEAAGNPKQVKDAPDKVSFTVEFTEVDEDENETVKVASFLAFRPDATDSE